MGWTPLRDYAARRIAIIKPSSLGDIVHSLPVLSALRQRYPAAHICWVVNANYETLLTGHPDLDATLPLDRRAMRRGWMTALHTWRRFIHELRRQKFDLVVDLQGLLRSGLMTGLSGATRRVGLSSAREGASRFYTDIIQVPNAQALHAVDRYWHIAERFGVGDVPKSFRLPIDESAQRWATVVLSDMPHPWLMVGVGARWQTKRWPPEHFASLLQRAQKQFGGSAIFVGGAEETEPSRLAMSELPGPSRVLAGRTSLPQLAALLNRADVVVANDTGPLHLAAALGRPIVAPYTCTKVQLTGPYGALTGAVEAPIWCQGSRFKRCSRLECMDALAPALLWPHLEEILCRWKDQSHSDSSSPAPRRRDESYSRTPVTVST
jgi:lipopolysaccharide heptosyltransferase I